jgi:tRNA dimethylallyltransferase
MSQVNRTKKHLICVIGPTASGKTSLAINIAQYFNCDIVSADSRQFYAEMNIGTAKPSDEELRLAPHHFIGHLSVHDEYSAGHFEKNCISKLESLFEQNTTQVLVGGSGMYVDAVCDGFSEIPKADTTIREELNKELNANGLGSLLNKLKELDLDYYHQVDKNNPQRIIRGLEVSLSTGKPYSSFRKGTGVQRNFKTTFIQLDWKREELYNRINKRVDLMMEDGLLDEVRSLLDLKTLNSLNTVGYSELFSHLNGEYSLERAVELIKQNTRRFAKRQLTWFGKRDKILVKPDWKMERIIPLIRN